MVAALGLGSEASSEVVQLQWSGGGVSCGGGGGCNSYGEADEDSQDEAAPGSSNYLAHSRQLVAGIYLQSCHT